MVITVHLEEPRTPSRVTEHLGKEALGGGSKAPVEGPPPHSRATQPPTKKTSRDPMGSQEGSPVETPGILRATLGQGPSKLGRATVSLSRVTLAPMEGLSSLSRASANPTIEGLSSPSRATVKPTEGLSKVFLDLTTAGLSSPRVLLRRMLVLTGGRRRPNRVSTTPTPAGSRRPSRALLDGPSKDTVALREGVRNPFRVTAPQVDPMEGQKNLSRVTVV